MLYKKIILCCMILFSNCFAPYFRQPDGTIDWRNHLGPNEVEVPMNELTTEDRGRMMAELEAIRLPAETLSTTDSDTSRSTENMGAAAAEAFLLPESSQSRDSAPSTILLGRMSTESHKSQGLTLDNDLYSIASRSTDVGTMASEAIEDEANIGNELNDTAISASRTSIIPRLVIGLPLTIARPAWDSSQPSLQHNPNRPTISRTSEAYRTAAGRYRDGHRPATAPAGRGK